MTVPVSVLLLVLDEEAQIERCLQGVAGWAADIHVVDSGSTDGTVELARKYTCHIHSHAFVDHPMQLAWAFANIPFAHEWLVLLDADHLMTPSLKKAMERVLAKPEPGVDAYYARHRYVFDGQVIHGFKPWSLRLIRHGRASIDRSEMVDYRVAVKGRVGYLNAHIIEDNVKERNIDFWIDKHQKFSTRLAMETVLRSHGLLGWSVQPDWRGNHDERMVWIKECWAALPLFVRPFLYFGYRYFFRCGFLDGRTGLVYHLLQAFWYRLLVDVKIARIQGELRAGVCSLDDLAQQSGHWAMEEASR